MIPATFNLAESCPAYPLILMQCHSNGNGRETTKPTTTSSWMSSRSCANQVITSKDKTQFIITGIEKNSMSPKMSEIVGTL